MRINLRPETEQRIQDRMKAGAFPSPDDVVDAGLKLLEQREQQKQGDVVDGEKFFKKMLAELEGDGELA